MAPRATGVQSSKAFKRNKPHALQPIPPSPSSVDDNEVEVDISRWRELSPEGESDDDDEDEDEDDDNDVQNRPNGSKFLQRLSINQNAISDDRKGKGKQRASPDHADHQEVDSPEAMDETFFPDLISLEPLEDDEVETRQVEENLRRWELAERQRRKAARTSTTASPSPGTTHGPSFMGEVANFLWPPRFSVTQHDALRSRESMDVPLTDLAPTSPRTASPTPTDSRAPTPTQDPFANPRSHTPSTTPTTPTGSPIAANAGKRRESNTNMPTRASPFDDVHQITGLSPTAPRSRAKLSRSRSSRLQPPPPLPLGLPPPRTPPPALVASPDAGDVISGYDDTRPTRWWHEWLCGFGEGPDRGGDHQAGRTNPFE